MDFSGIDAIIFDNDGVLVDSETIHVAVERELLSELGLEYDHATYVSRFVGLKNADFHVQLAQDYQSRFQAPFPSDFRQRLDARAWPRIEAELRPLPGIADLLADFRGATAVASSATIDRLHQKLSLTGLYERFAPHVYSSDLVANGKPAPDLFLYAAKALGVPPTRCMIIEDSVNGVRAGRAANMLTIGFTGGGHTDENHAARLEQAGAHLSVDSHTALAALMRG